MNIDVLKSDWRGYELLDSGDRLKLERFGDAVVVRSEPKAWWKPSRPDLWKSVDARYFDDEKKDARWVFNKKISAPVMDWNGIKFRTKFMDGTKHLGVFPEQSPHWKFIAESGARFAGGRKPKLLNLFGYTGAATLAAAKGGFAVAHVDASKPSVDWARKNQSESGLADAPIRWIVDDALKFARREARRGVSYEAIVLDPPAFGRGPKNELWKLEKMLPELLDACASILSDTPLFVLMTLYSIEASSIMAANMLDEYFGGRRGAKTSCGELVLPASNGFDLPLSIYAKTVFE
ncbi:MAG: class I SAM-dependent methyltransferase [Candidatus Merdousia sp.]|nr:class I SAM-dependent methyltransferase [Candidatus Merdousia sp.]